MRNRLLLATCAALAFACGPDKPAPVAPQPTGAPTEPAPVTPDPAPEPTPAPAPTPPPEPEPPPPTPEELVKAAIATHAAGMKPLGNPIVQTLAAGGTFDAPVQVSAGKCYTVIAAGDQGIQELDVELFIAQPPLPETSVGQDSSTGATAIVGGEGKCVKNPLPLGGKGKVRLKATAGAGAVYAQVFVK
jgi:hypothetical protein